jgi:hypothetical protein
VTRLVFEISVLLCLAAVLGWGWSESQAKREALAERDELARQRTQALIAEGITRGLLDREEEHAAELAEALELLYGGPDAKLPEHIRRLLDRGL